MKTKTINVRDDMVTKQGKKVCVVIRDGIPIFTATSGSAKLFKAHRELNRSFRQLPDIVTDSGNRYMNWTIRGSDGQPKSFMAFAGRVS